ncbi:MAG TPA: hypothetical protein VHK88_15540 [Aquihabitans sp.]|jgi:hypothetical protein|nr:hypothetical protein [Aquihabitans sp.]
MRATPHCTRPAAPPRPIRRALAALGLASTLLVGAAAAPTSVAAAPTWAPPATATIEPGVQTFTEGAQCTANFVFTDGTDVYIGQAAHCSGTGEATETNGCEAGSLPLGTPVEVTGATRPGVLAYNSWLTMQAVGETDPDACQHNDFALIRLDPADHGRVNPSIPVYGGPVGLGDATAAGETVYSYGNSSLRGGVAVLSPKTGTSLGTDANGWNHPVYTLTPGIPARAARSSIATVGPSAS